MRTHLDTFGDYLYQSEQVGVVWSDFDRCDVFLASLPHDLTELLQLKWTTACAALGQNEDFDTLSTVYSSLAEQHRLRWEATEGAYATLPGILGPTRSNAEVSGPYRGQTQQPKAVNTRRDRDRDRNRSRDYARDRNRPNPNNHNRNSNPMSPACTYCERRFHNTAECYDAAAGLPSAAARRAAIANVRSANPSLPKRPGPTATLPGNAPFPKTAKVAAVTTPYLHAYDEDEGDFGDLTAAILPSDFDLGVDAHVTPVAAEPHPVTHTVCALPTHPARSTPSLPQRLRLTSPARNQRRYLLDSGAAIHLTNDASALASMRAITPRFFGQAGSGTLCATHVGTLHVPMPNGTYIPINDVFYAEGARLNLLSACRLKHHGWTVDSVNNTLSIQSLSVPILEAAFTNYVYLPHEPSTPTEAPTDPGPTGLFAVDTSNLDSPLFQLHRSLGHMSRTAMLRLASNGQLPLTLAQASADPFRPDQCWACLQTNSKRLPRNGHAPRASDILGEILHVDLTGPKVPTWSGKKYALVITADYCRIRYVALLAGKTGSEVYDELTKFVALLQTQTQARVRLIRCDSGPEFVNTLLRRYCEQRGIVIQSTAAYTPEHNGVSERAIGILKGRAAAMVASTTLGPGAWGHALQYACLIINMATPSPVEGKSAYELLTGRTPNFRKLLPFGDVVVAHVPAETRLKSDFLTATGRVARFLGRDTFRPGWLIRYEDDGKIDRVSDVRPTTGLPLNSPLHHPTTITTYRGTRVEPPPDQGKALLHPLDRLRDRRPMSLASLGRSVIPDAMRTSSLAAHAPTRAHSLGPTAGPTSTSGPPMPDVPRARIAGSAPPTTEPRRSARTPMPREPARSYAAATAPTTARPAASTATSAPPGPLHNIIAALQDVPPDADTDDMLTINDLMLASLDEPSLPHEPASYAEAMSGPNAAEWSAAWQQELDILSKMGSWEETTAPPGARLLTAKPVFRVKTQDGRVTRYKARCTVRGCAQRRGTHYDETFQPVSRASSLRLLLCLAATNGMDLTAADFDAAYLNAPIDKDDLYMRFPPGFSPANPEASCLRLKKSIYGLKQAGHLWWREIEQALFDYGLQRVESEWGLYALKQNGAVAMILLLYVDDILLASTTRARADALYDALGARFSVTKLGPATHILGVRITHQPQQRAILADQSAYIDTLTRRLPGLSPALAKYAPLPVPIPRTPDEPESSPDAARAYGTLVGKLLWVAFMTRPDIAYAVSYLARYTKSPQPFHTALALRVAAYLCNTRSLGLTLGGRPQRLRVYSDADWCADRDLRRSTSGFVVLLNDCVINWSARRQRLVAHSTMEAEYIAAADAAREVLWWRMLLSEIGMPVDGPTPLLIDNQAAIRLASNPLLHERSKHIELRHHAIRQLTELRAISLHYVPTHEQHADGFTKPLSGPRTTAFRSCLKLVPVPAS